MNSESDVVFGLLRALGARAAGLWHVEGEWLALDVFAPAADLPDEVAAGFSRATERVSLDRRELGIVGAVREGRVLVSRAGELPAEIGSGLWLRKFGAERSVAVPLDDGRRVFSVAVPETCGLDDEAIAEQVRRFGLGLPEG